VTEWRGPRTRAEQSALELRQPARSAAERDARAIGRQAGGEPSVSLAEVARRLGHEGGRVVETVARTRWFSMCACGFVSTTRNTEQDAAGALVHHVKLAIKSWHRTGLPIAAAKKAPAPDWDLVARRSTHYALWRKEVGEVAPGPVVESSSGESPRDVRRAV
jgi:hypothetical protein